MESFFGMTTSGKRSLMIFTELHDSTASERYVAYLSDFNILKLVGAALNKSS